MLGYGRERTSERKQERERNGEREPMVTGSFSAVTFRNLSYLGEDNFAMITLEMGDLSAMRTIRARRTTTTGKVKEY